VDYSFAILKHNLNSLFVGLKFSKAPDRSFLERLPNLNTKPAGKDKQKERMPFNNFWGTPSPLNRCAIFIDSLKNSKERTDHAN